MMTDEVTKRHSSQKSLPSSRKVHTIHVVYINNWHCDLCTRLYSKTINLNTWPTVQRSKQTTDPFCRNNQKASIYYLK